MCCDNNRCGCHRHKCNICGFFNGFNRRRCGCFNDDFGFERFERRERFERFDNCGNFRDFDRREEREERREHGKKRDEFTRADFDGFFPEARFERVTRECGCKR